MNIFEPRIIKPIDFIDNRNRSLYLDLNSKHGINVWNCGSQNKPMHAMRLSPNMTVKGYEIFIYDFDNRKNGFFTHELLHILFFENGFKNVSYLEETLRKLNNEKLNEVFSDRNFRYNVIDQIAHSKMLSAFLKLKYLKREFILEYDENPIMASEHVLVKKSILGTTLFIKQFFLTTGIINDNHSVEKANQLLKLDSYNPALFSILYSNWSAWIQTDSINNELFLTNLLDQLSTYSSALSN